jgi:hypothetical protein
MLSQEYTENLIKVTFEINLDSPKGKEKFDYKELVTFLDQIQHIHEVALRVAYNESKSKNLNNEKLVIDSFKLDNSLRFSISFFIDFDSFFPYYFAIKAMIGVCEKYGKNTDDLLKTLKRILLCFQEYIKNSPTILRRLGPKIRDLINNLNENIYLKELEELINNQGFKRIYNSFCKSAISIKNIISYFEFLGKVNKDVLIDNQE